MRRLVWIVTADSILVLMLVLLILHNAIKPYPTALLVIAALFFLNTWLLTKTFKNSSTEERDQVEVFGRRGAKRLLWVFSIGIVIALVVAVLNKDSRYLIQAGIGLFLVGYTLFVLRALNRKKTDGKP